MSGHICNYCGGPWEGPHTCPRLEAERDQATQRALDAERREKPLRSLAQWLVALDEPGATERRTVTLTQIIGRARAALAQHDQGGADL